MRPSGELSDYHTGRGGAANVHVVPESEKKKVSQEGSATAGIPPPMVGLADKLKNKITGVFKK